MLIIIVALTINYKLHWELTGSLKIKVFLKMLQLQRTEPSWMLIFHCPRPSAEILKDEKRLNENKGLLYRSHELKMCQLLHKILIIYCHLNKFADLICCDAVYMNFPQTSIHFLWFEFTTHYYIKLNPEKDFCDLDNNDFNNDDMNANNNTPYDLVQMELVGKKGTKLEKQNLCWCRY